MTTPSPSSMQTTSQQLDTGPLSWVMGEIREALARSRTSLREAVIQDAETQASTLRHAKAYLHQAHGALQMVDIDGVVIITETVEDILDRIEAGKLTLNETVVSAIGNAYQALGEYLQELLAGAPHQPVRLFPYYRPLLEARGAERIHPADLFFPNLAVRPQLPLAAPDAAVDYVALRKRFERALLPFLKSADGAVESAHTAAMCAIIADIEQVQSNSHVRAFWWVMHGFAEAVAKGQVRSEIYIKQVFARINLQLRRLSDGSTSIAERLLRDALFFIARAQNPSLLVRQIQAAYQIGGTVPVDYDAQRYGQVDAAASHAAKERLSQAKNLWNRIAGGDAAAADAFPKEMTALADACAKLNSPPLSKLLRELSGIARHAARANPGDSIGLEIATGLLFVENALSNIAQLSDDFAARADAMTTRLLAIVAGERPAEQTEWIDDMSKQAQQRQTVSVLATEMQSSLRQVEKMLEEYFTDPSQRDVLAQIGPVLHQIEGALAILDQDDAMHAVRYTDAQVRRFAEAETSPEPTEFEQVARNVGALSFFIESLQLNAEVARTRFVFDADKGVFHALLIEKKIVEDEEFHPELIVEPVSVQPESAPQVDSCQTTVEDELALQQKQSTELAVSLLMEPDNPALHEQLKNSLEQIQRDATLLDNAEAGERARAAIELLSHADLTQSNDTLANIISAAPVAPTLPEQPVAAAPDTDEAIDAELLEIFLMEAEEVLQCVCETIPRSRSEPFNQEHLTTLRRSFHTLKGSGRMVGLMAFGDAAWSIEQVLNLRLSHASGGDAELYALLDKAAELLGAWVNDLTTTGRSSRTAAPLVAAADRVKSGNAYAFVEAEPIADAIDALTAVSSNVTADDIEAVDAISQATVNAPPAESPEAHVPPPTGRGMDEQEEIALALPEEGDAEAAEAEFASLLAAVTEVNHPVAAVVTELPQSHHRDDAMLTEEDTQVPTIDAEHEVSTPLVVPVAEVIEFPTMQAEVSKIDDSIKQIGNLQISVPLHNIYLAETDELIRVLSQDIAEWRHEPERPVHIPAVHAAHSLAGSSATVGFQSLQEVAHALESVLQYLARRPVRLEPHEYDVLDHAIKRAQFMLQMFALGEMPEPEPHQVELLAQLLKAIDLRRNRPDVIDEPVVKTLSEKLQPVVADESAAIADAQIQAEAEAKSIIAPIESALLMDDISSLENSTDASGHAATEMDSIAPANDIALSDDVVSSAAAAVEAAVTEPTDAIHTQDEPLPVTDSDADSDAAIVLQDELDADLLPVFLEEGRDMLPEIGELLRAWQQQPNDKHAQQGLLRLLHTIKGSARMAGAMAFGQHMHDMETRIEQITMLGTPSSQALEDLLARHDHGLQMFEVLQNPEAAKRAAVIPPVQSDMPAARVDTDGAANVAALIELPSLPSLQTGKFVAPISPAPIQTATPATATPLVRVRADILDRLVNQAGEVSIARSKLETEVGTLRHSLTELNENVARMRDQLREIEMQAESQITSRMAQSADREFDPLEFDRFTRLQELTRMMAESVNDVGSVQQNLNRTVDSAIDDLTMQARLTRDLQQDLMRVRMIQFASISERLYRVTRQASKDANKRVNLDIRGGAVEIDRGVLDKMVGPFEHLLRNAIAHGIESREERLAAGKSEIGELLVEVRQEGNEVVIQFSDDGQGLDLHRIRDKAVASGLLASDADLSDAETSELIFHPGFSTAGEVTELAGRGIGMDVVRSEASTLGGRVSILTESGKGAHFTIHLPLTLAVTQVVLLTTGGRTYAVPSGLVEQVQQLKVANLTTAYNDGAVMWRGQRVGMYYLPTLLGDLDATPVTQQYSPILILRSGNDRVAVHVDEVIGNREVVVKNIGPQLARMIGIAGATVLGSGDIVLILNPVPLAQRLAQENVRAPRLLPSDVPQQMGAIAETSGKVSAAPDTEAVQGLRKHRIVMVVDDSMTVRRVTQRLLSREGYQVVLAKDGIDALEQLQSITPDVMLVDIEMPRMDGFDLTRNVRSDERTSHIPIVMITSRTASKHRNYAMELGVNEYLGKPYQEDMLLKLIGDFVKKETPVA